MRSYNIATSRNDIKPSPQWGRTTCRAHDREKRGGVRTGNPFSPVRNENPFKRASPRPPPGPRPAQRDVFRRANAKSQRTFDVRPTIPNRRAREFNPIECRERERAREAVDDGIAACIDLLTTRIQITEISLVFRQCFLPRTENSRAPILGRRPTNLRGRVRAIADASRCGDRR